MREIHKDLSKHSISSPSKSSTGHSLSKSIVTKVKTVAGTSEEVNVADNRQTRKLLNSVSVKSPKNDSKRQESCHYEESTETKEKLSEQKTPQDIEVAGSEEKAVHNENLGLGTIFVDKKSPHQNPTSQRKELLSVGSQTDKIFPTSLSDLTKKSGGSVSNSQFDRKTLLTSHCEGYGKIERTPQQVPTHMQPIFVMSCQDVHQSVKDDSSPNESDESDSEYFSAHE